MTLRMGMIILVTAVLAGCGSGRTYPVEFVTARDALLETRPPSEVFGTLASSSSTTPLEADKVRWNMGSNAGGPRIDVIATLSDAGSGKTRVSVEAVPAQGSEEAAKKMEEFPAVANFYRVALEEQIDAKLEGRPFDHTAVQAAAVAAMYKLLPKMREEAFKTARETAGIQASTNRSNFDAGYDSRSRGMVDRSRGMADQSRGMTDRGFDD